MFKIGTMLHHTVVDGRNILRVFDTPEKIATSLNQLAGLECLTGTELATAVARGNVGQSPPRRGRNSSVPEDIFSHLAYAVFSFSTIQQINNGERATRSQLSSLVGEIVNAKREAVGLDPLGAANFFRRIELRNSRKQTLEPPDKREMTRVRWLTYQAQEKNYQRWEETLVDLGFAREATDFERSTGKYVIFLQGQESRIVNLDEMSISLDASSTQGGGRPSQVPEANGVQGSGEAAPKSSNKVTGIFGMNFADEVLPAYLQFPTKAKTEDRYRLKAQILSGFRQVKGRFGYPEGRYHWFDVGFGMNPKGKPTQQ
jgi:hypothetical protein